MRSSANSIVVCLLCDLIVNFNVQPEQIFLFSRFSMENNGCLIRITFMQFNTSAVIWHQNFMYKFAKIRNYLKVGFVPSSAATRGASGTVRSLHGTVFCRSQCCCHCKYCVCSATRPPSSKICVYSLLAARPMSSYFLLFKKSW